MNKVVMAKRLLVSTIGVLILGFGCGMVVMADVGGDPLTVFITSVANLYPALSVGNWTSIVCVALIVITLIIDRKCIGVTTILHTFLAQFTIDLAINLIPTPDNYVLKVLLLLAALIIIAIAVAIMTAADFGFAAYDAVIMSIAKKVNFSYKKVRLPFDAFFLVVGYLIGGTVGLGTIICLTIAGLSIDFALAKITPPLKNLVFKSK